MIRSQSVPEPAPDTYIPNEVDPIRMPPWPDQPPEIDEPPPAEPVLPIREPGRHLPAQAEACGPQRVR